MLVDVCVDVVGCLLEEFGLYVFGLEVMVICWYGICGVEFDL